MSEVENFIIRQLESAHIDYSVRREFIHVACPFHEHSGRKQKLGFSRTSGGMHCFVCEKKGHWNEYARLRGLETFAVDDTRLQDFDALRAQFDRLTVERQIETPDWLEPWQGTWRGVSFETLASMPSYRWYDGASKGYRTSGVDITDNDSYLHFYAGYWFYTMQPNISVIVPIP